MLFILVVALSGGPAVAEGLEDLLLDLAIFPLDGKPPSDFALEGLDGKPISLRAFKGKVVLLYFWTTT